MLKRRGLLVGLGAALFAPAIIRTPGLLMPIRRVRFIVPPTWIVPPGEIWEIKITPASINRYQGQLAHTDELAAAFRRLNIETPVQWPPTS